MKQRSVVAIFFLLALTLAIPSVVLGVITPNHPGETSDRGEMVPDEVIIRFKENVNPKVRRQLEDSIGLRKVLKRTGPGGRRDIYLYKLEEGMLPDRIVKQLRANPYVLLAEANYICEPAYVPNDSGFAYQWGLRNTGQNGGTAGADIDACNAWDIEKGYSNPVTVAVIDSGIDYNHPDLASAIWKNKGEIPNNGKDDDANGYIDDAIGYDFYASDGDPKDELGHGTKVSGVIGATSDNTVGASGISHGVKIMSLKVGGSAASFDGYAILEAIYYAADHGAKVINMSFSGTDGGDYFQSAINYAFNKGVIIFAAAGNSGNSTIYYPAACSNVIGIGATTNKDEKAYFSTYNSTVDLSAPGQDIYTTYSGGGYGYTSGTSLASPIAAGVAALLLAYDSNMTPSNVEQVLKQSADDLGVIGRDDYFGYGRVNAYQVLTAVKSAPMIVSNLSNITFSADLGGDNPAAQMLDISNGGSGTLHWSVSGNANWLGISPTSGEDTGTVQVTANISGLTGGWYPATITITAPGASNSPVTIPVGITIKSSDTTEPTAPAGVKAMLVGSSVSLSWTASTDNVGVAGYKVERATSSSGPWVEIGDTDSPSFTDTKTSSGKTYYYRVRAYDGTRNYSSYSPTISKAVPTIRTATAQQTSSYIKYTGNWLTSTSSSYSGGSAKYSKTAGDFFEFAFRGTSVTWISAKKPARGKADVYIDGQYIATVDEYSSSTLYQQTIFNQSGLIDTAHTMKIVVTGQKRAEAVDATVEVDAFKFTSVAPGFNSEQTSSSVTWAGSGWQTSVHDLYSGGSAGYSKTSNNSAEFTFNGTAVYWVGAKKPARGIAKVYIDGRYQTTVNQYSANTDYQLLTYSKTGLANRTHKIKIVVTGTKSSSASDPTVEIDAFGLY